MAALRSLAMDHADVAALVLLVVPIVANGKPIRMAKEAAKVVSTSLVIARASAALSANLLMVSVVDVAAAVVVAAVATIVVVVADLDVVVVVAEIAVDAVVSDVVVEDAAAAVALATDHSTRRQSRTKKLHLTIKI